MRCAVCGGCGWVGLPTVRGPGPLRVGWDGVGWPACQVWEGVGCTPPRLQLAHVFDKHACFSYCRYFMVGGSQSGTVGTQQGLAAAGGQVPLPGDGVFGPGVIGAHLTGQ